jgi:predicted nuclease of predicted toxin-antitoxin system
VRSRSRRGLKQADDRSIWKWAKDNRHTIVTADSDFVAMVTRTGPPPKVIHIERRDFPFRAIEELLRQNAIRISRFENDASARVPTLRPVLEKGSR